jgi:hypothetical protein
MDKNPVTAEQDLAALSDLLSHPHEITRPMMDQAVFVLRAVQELHYNLHFSFDPNGQPLQEVEALWTRVVRQLDTIHRFLAKLNMQSLLRDLDELQSALEDRIRGIESPTLKLPSWKTNHSDSSLIWRAKANLVLAVEARQALLALDRTEESTFRAATLHILETNENIKLVERLLSKTGSTTNDERLDNDLAKKKLTTTITQWKKDLSSRPPNKEADDLYRAGHNLISANTTDENMLSRIEGRCLHGAARNGAFKPAR